jgi:hypothetical protein
MKREVTTTMKKEKKARDCCPPFSYIKVAILSLPQHT